MSSKFIVVAIGMVIGLALTPVIASSIETLTMTTGTFGSSSTTFTGNTRDAIASILNLVPLAYVAAILLVPVVLLFRGRGKGGM